MNLGQGTRPQGRLHAEDPQKARRMQLFPAAAPAGPLPRRTRPRPWSRPPCRPRLLCFSVCPVGAVHPEDGGRGGKVAPDFGEWLAAGHRRGDTVVAPRTCFPVGIPLPCGLGAFHPSWRISEGNGAEASSFTEGSLRLRRAALPPPHPSCGPLPQSLSLQVVGPRSPLHLSIWLSMQATWPLVPVL